VGHKLKKILKNSNGRSNGQNLVKNSSKDPPYHACKDGPIKKKSILDISKATFRPRTLICDEFRTPILLKCMHLWLLKITQIASKIIRALFHGRAFFQKKLEDSLQQLVAKEWIEGASVICLELKVEVSASLAFVSPLEGSRDTRS